MIQTFGGNGTVPGGVFRQKVSVPTGTLLMFQVSMHLYSCMLFPVWRSALVHTDCQSNALTPSICSMVTSLMDVMSWVAASINCYLLCGHSTQATVRSSVYT